MAAALDYLRPGDTLVVWKLDRLGRSVKEVLTIADDLHARGVGVRILTGKLSGSFSPHGEGKFWRATASRSAGGRPDRYLAANASRGRASRCTCNSTRPR